MEDPDFVICPCVIDPHPSTVGTGDGDVVGVEVLVGVGVMVAVAVLVGVRLGVNVREGVHVNCRVGLGVGVKVLVGVSEGVLVSVDVLVGVLEGVAVAGFGVSVTAIEMLRRMVRALIPSIGFGGLLVADRERKGTSLGTIGKKSPSISTRRRCLLSARIVLVRLGSVTMPLKQNSIPGSPGP